MFAHLPIFLVGPMGSGKTAVGQRLAKLLERRFVDTDRKIEERCGVDIAFIFDKEGEAGFRKREHQALVEFAGQAGLIIATGGGVITQASNREILQQTGIVIYLQTSVDQQFERTRYSSTRPLLSGDDPKAKLHEFMALRAPLYASVADITCNTDGQRVNQVANEIVTHLEHFDGKKKDSPVHTLTVKLDTRSYPIFIGEQLLGAPNHWQRVADLVNFPQRLLVISDNNVAPLYLDSLRKALPAHTIDTCILKAGEAHKTLSAISTILDQLVAGSFQRDTAIIALGGGVVGDIAGFAAACFMRGVRFIQVPTTLLAQVDSSVGGKTGVNHTLGKNLIGAFHQPVAVVIDTDTLVTLGAREVRAGLAEVIKYGCIYDVAFFAWLEDNMPALLALERPALAYAIRRSCEIKAQIVARDEKEKGERALLNFGHSFGHAIEQVTGYTRWLHGEAVAIGMLMACELSVQMGFLSDAEHQRVARLLSVAQLPSHSDGTSIEELQNAMQKDKKNTATDQRLVLLNGLGKGQIRSDCTSAAIAAALSAYSAD